MRYSHYVVVGLTIVLTACSIAFGKKFSGFDPLLVNHAELYVFRTEGENLSGITGAYPAITVDGKKIGVLKRSGYLRSRMVPGQYVVATVPSHWNWPMNEQKVSLTMQAGERYFIELSTSAGKAENFRIKKVLVGFHQVSESRALDVLPNLVYSE